MLPLGLFNIHGFIASLVIKGVSVNHRAQDRGTGWQKLNASGMCKQKLYFILILHSKYYLNAFINNHIRLRNAQLAK